MKVGYAVPVLPELASYRFRVAIPAEHMGIPYQIGCTGNPTFFFKNGNVELAKHCPSPVVYDVVNDHFTGKHAEDYHGMCKVADAITCASPVMRDVIKMATGRDATVIVDPYENALRPPAVIGDRVLWFGHGANAPSVQPYLDAITHAVTGYQWSLEYERDALDLAAVVLLTGNNPGASANRPAKAIRAGRFVVCPDDSPASWAEIPGIWLGDVREGIRWALNNREEACNRIRAGQKYTQSHFNPRLIGLQWADLFASTLGLDTRKNRVGLASISTWPARSPQTSGA